MTEDGGARRQTGWALEHHEAVEEDQLFLRKLRLFVENSNGNLHQSDGAAVIGTSEQQSTGYNTPNMSSAGPDLSARLNVLDAYKMSLDKLKQEYIDLSKFFARIGGNPIVTAFLRVTPERLSEMYEVVKSAMVEGDMQAIKTLKRLLDRTALRTQKLITVLYNQKHTFYFRNLQRWEAYTEEAVTLIDLRADSDQNLEQLVHHILPQFIALNDDVVDELRDFAVKVLPLSVADEEDRDTSQYVSESTTTIAIFLSSVTATMLQISYQQTNTLLGNLVNLFWFLSLVFSIFSGVNCVLSATWRKSFAYFYDPPKPIELWLTKGPMVFLAISACTFVIGLNLFPYSSHQANFVSVMTLAFTSLHTIGLLVATAWFLVKLNWPTYFMQNIRRNILWAFLCDNRVVHLNFDLANRYGWSDSPLGHPNLLSKLVRRTMLISRGIIPKLICTMVQYIKRLRPPDQINLETIEAGKVCNSADMACHTPSSCTQGIPKSVVKAIEDYTRFAKNTVASSFFEDLITTSAQKWKDGAIDTDGFEMKAQYVLWGYPELLAELRKTVIPMLRAIDAQAGESDAVRSPATSHPVSPMVRSEQQGG